MTKEQKLWLETAVLLCCQAALFTAQCAPSEPTIRWHPIGDTEPPQTLVLSPAAPTITNVIGFIAPTDGHTYANDCVASASNGVPNIDVDGIFQKVTVSFSAPETNVICPSIVIPVSGVEGEIGPLEAGAWVFDILGNTYTFTVSYVPMALSVQPLSNSTSLQISWLNSGEVFELQSCDNLSAGNWLNVTNTSTLSSNLITVQIDSTSSARFFRLQRLVMQ